MIKNITVIGGGSTGHAAAAYLTEKGFQVTICDNHKFEKELQAIEENDGILLRGRAGRGIDKIACVTHDFQKAVESAELIMVCVPARRHEEIARKIAPYVKENQSILILPGNLGSFIFKNVFEEQNAEPVLIAEMEGNLCPCRLTGPAEVTVGLPIRAKKIAVLPGSRTEEFIKKNEGVLEFVANKNVLEGALLSDNYVLHIGTTLLASSKVAELGDEFGLFLHGITDYSIKCTDAIRKERIQLLKCFGLQERDSATEFVEELRDWKNHPEYAVFRTLKGPDSLTHRYVDEDAMACGAMALSCAEKTGTPMPVLKSVITIVSAINGKDYLAEGRTLNNVGFADDTMEEILNKING